MQVSIKMPQLGESVAEGKVTQWLKKVGDLVERDENLLEVTTDKVTVEVPSIAKGTLTEVLVQEGEIAQVGDVLAYLDSKEAIVQEEKQEEEPPKPQASQAAEKPKKKKVQSSKSDGQREIPPGVKTFAQEMGVDLSQVVGSGEEGRVRRKDVVAFLAKQGGAKPVSFPEPVLEEGDQLIPLTNMRRVIAEHMVLSKRTIPHVMTSHEVDMLKVMEERAKNPEKPSVTAYIAWAVAAALKKYPQVNSQFTEKGIIQRKAINVGIAIATEEGLLVPPVKEADKKNVSQLNKAIRDLAERARTKKLLPDELYGGTFTITNPGVFGANLLSAPVIPFGQSGIVGVSAIVKRPVVREDQIVIRPILNLSLSFDHRTFDGALAEFFLDEIRRILEEAKWN